VSRTRPATAGTAELSLRALGVGGGEGRPEVGDPSVSADPRDRAEGLEGLSEVRVELLHRKGEESLDEEAPVGPAPGALPPAEFFDGAELVVLPGVFVPEEAETMVLPFLWENRALFDGKTVLEIGTGTGIISAYAAKLGARKVVSTPAYSVIGSDETFASRVP
jgi:methylase of polypeptide subunit release factors